MREQAQDEVSQASGAAGTKPSIVRRPQAATTTQTFDEYGEEASLQKRGKKEDAAAQSKTCANDHARCKSTSAKGRAANLEMQQKTLRLRSQAPRAGLKKKEERDGKKQHGGTQKKSSTTAKKSAAEKKKKARRGPRIPRPKSAPKYRR